MRAGRVGTLVALGLAVGLLGVLLRAGTWPPMATVESDSMRPTFAVGDLLILGRAERIAVGDVVVVPVPARLQAERGYPERLAHRVAAIEDGMLTTQGDRLAAPDPFAVPASAVAQRAVARVPFAGHIVAFVRSPVGMIWLIGGLLVLAIRARARDDSQTAAMTPEDIRLLRAAAIGLLEARRDAEGPAAGEVGAAGTAPASGAPDRAFGETGAAAAAARAGEAARRALAGLGPDPAPPETERDAEAAHHSA